MPWPCPYRNLAVTKGGIYMVECEKNIGHKDIHKHGAYLWDEDDELAKLELSLT